MRNFIDIINEAGAGVSRLTQHIRSGTPFVMLSAARGTCSAAENKQRAEALRKRLSAMPVSYIVTGGEYQEVGQDAPTEEVSFFIMPRSSKVTVESLSKLGLGLCKIFDQDSYLLGDGKEINLVEQDGSSMVIGNAASFDPAVVAKAPAFSKIKGRKLTFTNSGENPGSVAYGSAKDGPAT